MMALGPLDNPLILQRVNYHSRLRKLISYMREHPAEPLSLGVAARIVYMERTAFCKFFSRTVGMPFHEFVQKWKIASAVEKMMVSDCSLAEVAYTVGFENINSFGRTFKKVTSMTPSEYRRRLLSDRQIIQPMNEEKWPTNGDS